MKLHSTSLPAWTLRHDYRPKRAAKQQLIWGIILVTIILNDLFMTFQAFLLTNALLPLFGLNAAERLFHDLFTFYLVGLWLLVFGIFGLYNRKNLIAGSQEFSLVIKAATLGMFAVILAGFFEKDPFLNRSWLFAAWLFTILFVSAGRLIIRLMILWLRSRGNLLTTAVIVGACSESKFILEQLSQFGKSGMRIAGVVDDTLPKGSSWESTQILGPTARLDKLINHHNIEKVIVAHSAFSQQEIISLFKQYGTKKGLHFCLSSGLYDFITTGIEVLEVSNVPLTTVRNVRLTGFARLSKILVDYCLSIPIMILGCPLFLGLALAIKLDSPGPVFHKRKVMGTNGRTFQAFKFRTMYTNGDELLANYPALQAELARHHKLKNDPRITRIGHFLRKTSLDELPQLINVLRQQMSLIGPRMITPEELVEYEKWDVNLLTIQPGITGLWQVNGRSDVSYQERVRLDMYYVRNWSFWLDMNIILRTIPVILLGKGAY